MKTDAERCRDLLRASRSRWVAGDAAGTWSVLAEAADLAETADAAGAGPGLAVEVLAARSVAYVRAQREPEALASATRCLDLAAETGDGERIEPLRGAVADARVSRALALAGEVSATQPSRDPQIIAAALAELDAVGADSDPAVAAARSRAITGALVVRLRSIDDDLASGRGEAQAWIWVSQARVLSEGLDDPGTVVRQAVDLAFRTGQWERGWDYAHSAIDRESHRNERVSVLAKATLLAWERGLDSHSRDLGQRAMSESVAVDHPWVRTYAYLGGVIAAAAGAGSLAAALSAYRACTTLDGHRTRPNRAWLAAQVALDAGHPVARVRAFLSDVAPDGLSHPGLQERAEIQLSDRQNEELSLELVNAVGLPRLNAPDRARVLLARARAHARAGRPSAAAGDLQHARSVLRNWPGRVLDAVDAEIERLIPQVPATPAQRRVLGLVVEGWSNETIADRLDCSDRTVAVHVSALLRRSGASSRTELAARELRRRMLAEAPG